MKLQQGLASPGLHFEGEGTSEGALEAVRQAVGAGCAAVGGGYCRLRLPLELALGVRETVAGHRLGALEKGGGGYLHPLPMHHPPPPPPPQPSDWRLPMSCPRGPQGGMCSCIAVQVPSWGPSRRCRPSTRTPWPWRAQVRRCPVPRDGHAAAMGVDRWAGARSWVPEEGGPARDAAVVADTTWGRGGGGGGGRAHASVSHSGGGLVRALLEGEGCDRGSPRAVAERLRGCDSGWGRRLLAVGNAVGAGVGVWECLLG